MSPRSKKEYLEAIFLRYKRSESKEQKTKILNEFCEVCGYHRKHAIRLLIRFKRFIKPKPRKRGKPSVYNQPAILQALERIWLTRQLSCDHLPSFKRWFSLNDGLSIISSASSFRSCSGSASTHYHPQWPLAWRPHPIYAD